MNGVAAMIGSSLFLVPLAGAALRRWRRAARGYAWFLGMRRSVLRGYARRRDCRTYHPARNPEAAQPGAPRRRPHRPPTTPVG